MNTLKFLAVLFLATISLNGCLPAEEEAQSDIDTRDMLTYLANNKIDYQSDSFGFYYNILSNGDGAALTDSSVVRMSIKASTTSGSALQENLNDTILIRPIYGFLPSIQVGLKRVKIGSEIIFYIPAYLNNGTHGVIAKCKPTQLFKDQVAADDTLINEYLVRNKLTAAKDSSTGIYYNITAAGTGSKPTPDSMVTVKYSGKLINNYVFDKTQEGKTYTNKLSALIVGWQKCMPLLAEGGVGRFYIPSGLAYKNNNQGDIPPNSILIFDITLVSVAK